jgi:predicted membrane protein
LVLVLIGLIGIIKEKKWIVIAITVISTIATLSLFFTQPLIFAILSITIPALTGYYAYLIGIKEKEDLPQISN